ncbi:MAG: hypothetical protein ABSF52_03680 [Syntrophobacteraceae bacterium]|jgi:hypothetical protein
MMAEWRELGTLSKIFYIGGVVSAIGLAVMILSGFFRLAAISLFENTTTLMLSGYCEKVAQGAPLKAHRD